MGTSTASTPLARYVIRYIVNLHVAPCLNADLLHRWSFRDLLLQENKQSLEFEELSARIAPWLTSKRESLVVDVFNLLKSPSFPRHLAPWQPPDGRGTLFVNAVTFTGISPTIISINGDQQVEHS